MWPNRWQDWLTAAWLALIIVAALAALVVTSGGVKEKVSPPKRQAFEMRVMTITVDGVRFPPLPFWTDATNVQIEIK